MSESRDRVLLRPRLERWLDRPQRFIERSSLSADAKMIWASAIRYLKQIIRSRSLRRR